MDIIQFIQRLSSGKPLPYLICFEGKQYPFIFFGQLFRTIRARNLCNIQNYTLEEHAIAEVFSAFSTTFLGEGKAYWCGNLSVLKTRDKAEYMRFLSSYQGPHNLLVFVNAQDKFSPGKDGVVIQVDQLQVSMYQKIVHEMYGQCPTFIEQACKKYAKQLTLDTLFLIMQYAELFEEEKIDYSLLDRVMPSAISLFQLTESFFAKNMDVFMKKWDQVKEYYPVEFWIVFWAEQIWQAFLFVQQGKTKGLVAAKKIARRLPFSFMQKDWRNYTIVELVHAHHFLYNLDYNLKNGSSSVGLDLFLLKFLAGGFKSP